MIVLFEWYLARNFVDCSFLYTSLSLSFEFEAIINKMCITGLPEQIYNTN